MLAVVLVAIRAHDGDQRDAGRTMATSGMPGVYGSSPAICSSENDSIQPM
jgi:hypothetical protein